MKNFIIGFIVVVVAVLALNSDFVRNKNTKTFSVTADTNISKNPQLSKYVSQEEVDSFAFRHWDIDDDKVMNNDKMENLRLLLKSKDTAKILNFMKDNNISVDEPLHYGVTALMYASFYNDIETAKELINLGADPHKKDKYKLSPMAYAIENNATKAVKLLLDNGVKFDEVDIVQFYLLAPRYYNIDVLELDKNGKIQAIYNHKYGEIPYEINKKTGEKRFTGGGGLYFFAYLVRENLYDIAKMALESGYKPYMFHSNNTVYEDTRYANSMEEMLGEEELEKLKQNKALSGYEYRCSLYERLEGKPDYNNMLNLLLDYNLTYIPTSNEFLKEEYDRCYDKYRLLIRDKVQYLNKIYTPFKYRNQKEVEYMVYKYAKENNLTERKLKVILDGKKDLRSPYEYIKDEMENSLAPNPYIIEYYDNQINLYSKYCGDKDLDFERDLVNWNDEIFAMANQYQALFKWEDKPIPETANFKDIVEYTHYLHDEAKFISYDIWTYFVNRERIVFLKDKNMTYPEYANLYKQGKVVLDDDSYIDRVFKSAKTDIDKKFFRILNDEKIENLKKEFYK